MSIEPLICPKCHTPKTDGCCLDGVMKMMAEHSQMLQAETAIMRRQSKRVSRTMLVGLTGVECMYLWMTWAAWVHGSVSNTILNAGMFVLFGVVLVLNAQMSRAMRKLNAAHVAPMDAA